LDYVSLLRFPFSYQCPEFTLLARNWQLLCQHFSFLQLDLRDDTAALRLLLPYCSQKIARKIQGGLSG
jgi:hypothetical protein